MNGCLLTCFKNYLEFVKAWAAAARIEKLLTAFFPRRREKESFVGRRQRNRELPGDRREKTASVSPAQDRVRVCGDAAWRWEREKVTGEIRQVTFKTRQKRVVFVVFSTGFPFYSD